MSLHTLVYISLATKPMTDTDLTDLLASCRSKNRKLEVTGLLLYRDGFFMQALEGEENVLDTLFRTIKRDQRHSDVLLVYKEAVDERSFAEWSMGFKSFDRNLLMSLDGFDDFFTQPAPEFFLRHPGQAKSLLYTFRTRHPLTDLGPGSMDLPEMPAYGLAAGKMTVNIPVPQFS